MGVVILTIFVFILVASDSANIPCMKLFDVLEKIAMA